MVKGKMEECHHKGKGWMMLVLGLLVLANSYWGVLSWDIFIGVILALIGLGKLLFMRK